MANNVQNPLELNPTVGGKQYAAGISKTKMQSLVDEVNKVDDKYEKPAGGIPSSDLSSAVQGSLAKADESVSEQTFEDTITAVYDDIHEEYGTHDRLNQLEDWGNIANETTLRNMLSDENNLSKEHTQRISFNVGGKAGFAIVNYHGNKLYYEEYALGVNAYARSWSTSTSSSSGWTVVDSLTLYSRLNSIRDALSYMPSGENYGPFNNAKGFEDVCTQETGAFVRYPAQWLVGTNTTNNCSLMILNIRGNDVTIDGVTHRRYTQYYFLNGNLYTRNVDSEDGATAWHHVTLDGWRLRTATNSRGQKELQLYNGNYLSGAVLVSDLTADVTSALSAAVARIATLESKVAALEAKMAQVDTILQDLIVSDSNTNNTNNDNNN